jgi:hypothetical protein
MRPAIHVLSACATIGSNTSASNFKCPADIVVENEDGSTMEYRGAMQEPSVCAVRTGRLSTPMLYGIQSVNVKSLREVRAGLADLFPLAVGKRSSFVTFDETYPGRTWHEKYEVLRHEAITVASDTFDTYVLQWTNISGGGSEHVYTYWIDTQTGIVLKKQGEWRSGVPLKEAGFVAEKLTHRATPIPATQVSTPN